MTVNHWVRGSNPRSGAILYVNCNYLSNVSKTFQSWTAEIFLILFGYYNSHFVFSKRGKLMNIKETVSNSIEMRKVFELISKEIILSSYKNKHNKKDQNNPLYNSFKYSNPPKK